MLDSFVGFESKWLLSYKNGIIANIIMRNRKQSSDIIRDKRYNEIVN